MQWALLTSYGHLKKKPKKLDFFCVALNSIHEVNLIIRVLHTKILKLPIALMVTEFRIIYVRWNFMTMITL